MTQQTLKLWRYKLFPSSQVCYREFYLPKLNSEKSYELLNVLANRKINPHLDINTNLFQDFPRPRITQIPLETSWNIEVITQKLSSPNLFTIGLTRTIRGVITWLFLNIVCFTIFKYLCNVYCRSDLLYFCYVVLVRLVIRLLYRTSALFS